MTRLFRFRVREGHQIIEFDDKRATTRGAGFELTLTEEETARFLRDRRNRKSMELVEVVEDDAAKPRAEPPGPD